MVWSENQTNTDLYGLSLPGSICFTIDATVTDVWFWLDFTQNLRFCSCFSSYMFVYVLFLTASAPFRYRCDAGAVKALLDAHNHWQAAAETTAGN